MRIDWNVPIEVSDGTTLRADVFRPIGDGRYPVLMTYGPYAKGLSFQDGYPVQWKTLVSKHPEVAEGTSTRYANWETCDPEKWVPDGYVCIRVDSRGSGMSPGLVDPFSPRETQDYYECIEWAGEQKWSTGKVGLLGVSYYAMNQWQVAAKRPPHLVAICPFEGASDLYRDAIRHGGILCTFWINWYPFQVTNVQHGLAENGRRSAVTGEPIAGTLALPEDVLAKNRTDIRADQLAHPLLDSYFTERNAVLEDIEVPVLSCANWGGQGLHLRGNVEGFHRAGSTQKWLEVHGREHWTEFYTDYGLALQKRFFNHFLKGDGNGWESQPPVKLQVRTIDGFVERDEYEWPLARTQWTRHYLDSSTGGLTTKLVTEVTSRSFVATEGELHFASPPFRHETELTGPVSTRLHISSSTTDADLFVTLRLFSPDDEEILFLGAVEPNAPVTQGWLRASHRATDSALSAPWRPVHVHTSRQPLNPDEIYVLDIEVWPTSIVVPEGYYLKVTIAGHDFDHGLPSPLPALYGIEQRGSSVYLHNDPADRPADVFAGRTTVFTGGEYDSHILLPVVP
ncbi:peptidase S15 [Mycolicibacterium goodii]|uniref:Peptidase S15 n=2 Tax=Mycolicibacterium goodii TaxID=134601 RepID=A0A0K0XGP9_MYCGD|nr:peptidase S15 [Mycolicibacterium goodii]